MILDFSPNEETSLPYRIPLNLPRAPSRSSLSPRPNLLPRTISSSPIAHRSTSTTTTTLSPAAITALVIIILLLLINTTWLSICLYNRRKRRNRVLRPYSQHTSSDTHGLIAHAAPPAIRIQGPSLNISRPISNPDLGPTPVFSVRESAEYTPGKDSGSLTDPNTTYTYSDFARQQLQLLQKERERKVQRVASELSAQTSPQYPATPHDPHGASRSREHSRSRSQPGHSHGYSHSYSYTGNSQPYSHSRSSSRTSNASNASHSSHKNKAFAQECGAHSFDPGATATGSRARDSGYACGRGHEREGEKKRLGKHKGDDEDGNEDEENGNAYFTTRGWTGRGEYPPTYQQQQQQHQYGDKQEYERGHDHESVRPNAKNGTSADIDSEIAIAMGKPLDVPDSPFSPGGERAAKAAAARGLRSEWYKSPPPERGGFK